RISDAQVALERAMELIGTAPARNKDRAKMLARLGDIELRREKTVEALALYEEAVTLWPDHYEVWGKLARVYDTLNRTTDADQSRAKQQEAMKRTGREFVGDSAP
ncbi:MAG: tetratricopeptide repeat protein, partial [Planctomycetota bacterium]|nr:tetratricopeptide repeat protein [Planctomycetota bacterium]